MHNRFAVVHPEHGVFVGTVNGYWFFSMGGGIETTKAHVFEDPAAALAAFNAHLVPPCGAVAVQCAEPDFATATELVASGVAEAHVVSLRMNEITITHPGTRRLQ